MITETMRMNLLGIYSANPGLLRERNEIMRLYSYFEGPARTRDAALHELTQGQSWIQATDLDYKPSQDIRNHTKKLILKQGRFMFGSSPSILMKPLKKEDRDKAEQKRMLIDGILSDSNFWGQTAKAFLDSTIGKRVLQVVVANPNQPIKYKYYTSLDFTYKTDPNDYTKLEEVIIAYCDADTADKSQDLQVWHRWKYYLKGEQCWLISGTYDGNAKSMGGEQDVNTGLDELPCRVIINGGLTGEVDGESDVEELMDLQNAYNQITSDYRDALKFKMFEQPVFIDADASSFENLKIAPNAMIDLKTDPSVEGGKADAKMLSSSFSFTVGADSFLDRIKMDLYEIMDQPRPEDLRDVPSAKALKFMFYDLMARCEEKWQEWEPAIKWLVKYTIKCVEKFNLYPELNAKAILATPTNIIIQHNYPIPEDEESQKGVAIKEVEAKVRSHRSYIRDFSDIEDEDGEWEEIIKEATELTTSSDSLTLGMAGAMEGEDNVTGETKKPNDNTDNKDGGTTGGGAK